MIWKFNQVYNADRQYADHQREAALPAAARPRTRRWPAGPEGAVRPRPAAPQILNHVSTVLTLARACG